MLSYSGLGFGGSGCEISLDDVDYDGRAGAMLIDWLGGRTPTTAYSSYDQASDTWSGPVAPPDAILLDDASTFDPSIGMVGGSYGGQSQFAVAARDDRMDALVPAITWNDLSYSIVPDNDTAGNGDVDLVLTSTEGVAKRLWGVFFSGLGAVSPLQNQQVRALVESQAAALASGTLGCPGFRPTVCAQLVNALQTGTFTPEGVATFEHASAESVIADIDAPTLLLQGQRDSLFNLTESVANYHALRKAGTPVSLVWKVAGHSGSGPDGEESSSSAFELDTNYIGAITIDWLDWFLKPDHGGADEPDIGSFSYFRPWEFDGSNVPGSYATAPSYPASDRQDWYLSGSDSLTTDDGAIVDGAATFAVAPSTPIAGLAISGSSFSEISAVNIVSGYGEDVQPPAYDLPGLSGIWTSEPLAEPLAVVGIPTLDAQLDAPTIALLQSSDPTSQLVLFAKLYDVAPDGTATLMNRMVSPVRVDDVTAPLHVQLPAMVHRFEAGHSVRLVLATSDFAYAGNSTLLSAAPVTVATTSASPGILSMPVVAGAPEAVAGPGDETAAPDDGSADVVAPIPGPAADDVRSLPATGPQPGRGSLPLGIAMFSIALGAVALVRSGEARG